VSLSPASAAASFAPRPWNSPLIQLQPIAVLEGISRLSTAISRWTRGLECGRKVSCPLSPLGARSHYGTVHGGRSRRCGAIRHKVSGGPIDGQYARGGRPTPRCAGSRSSLPETNYGVRMCRAYAQRNEAPAAGQPGAAQESRSASGGVSWRRGREAGGRCGSDDDESAG